MGSMEAIKKKMTGTSRLGDRHLSSTLVRLAPDVARVMRALSEAQDRPLTRIVRQAVLEYLEREGLLGDLKNL